MMVGVFDNGPGDLGSISVRVIPKNQKTGTWCFMLSTQQYEVGIKGKVEQYGERGSAHPYT